MTDDPGHHLGRVGEQLATEHLSRLGYEIVERNYRTRWGELDIVARAGDTLAFCEVKARRVGGRAGGPFDAVGPGKQARVRKMAGSWLLERRDRPYAKVIRFDAIGVTFDATGRLVSLEHLEGAF
jgi:putative endonuclease